MKHARKNAGVISLALAILLTAAWWFTLRAGLASENTTLRAFTQDLEATVQRQQTEVQQAGSALDVAQEETRAAQAELETLEASLPETPELTELMVTLNGLTDRHAVQHHGITEESREQLTDGLYRIDYTLSTVGTFEDQIKLLQDLHRQDRYIVASAVTMQTRPSDDPTLTPMIRVDTTLTTLVRGTLPVEDEEDDEPNFGLPRSTS